MQFKTEVGKSFGFTTQIKDLTVVSKPNYVYLTSTIYPTELIEELYTKSINVGGRSNTADDLGVYRFNQDGTKPSITQITGTLKVALKVYNYSRNEEEIDKVNLNVSNVSAILREVLLQYQIKEDNIQSSISGISGILRTVLIAYDYYGIENLNSVINKLTAIYSSVQTSYEVFIKGNNEVYKYPNTLRRMLLRATADTLLETTSTELTNYDLVFSTPFSEVDSKNVIIIFGAKSVPKEPEVIVNEYTTAALDFEDGLIDQIPTTIWNIEGTGTVQSVNKIFGKNSYESQNYPGGLVTSTDVITGNTTPFNIEFYALLKTSNSSNFPLLYKNYNGGMGEQGFYVGGDGLLRYHTYRGGWFGANANKKIRLNEINKYNITYDGSAIRMLIDDKLEFIVGSPYGIETSQHREPLSFFKRHVPGYDVYSEYTIGLIDNINIFNNTPGITRTKDGNEEFLMIDLPLDGENGSTKIVDNGFNNFKNENTNIQFYWSNNYKSLSNIALSKKFYEFGNNSIIDADRSCINLNGGLYGTITGINSKKFTYEAWIFRDSLSENWTRLFGFFNPTISDEQNNSMALTATNLSDGTCSINMYSNGGYLDYSYTNPELMRIPLKQWVHVCFMGVNDGYYFYVNGTLASKITTNESLINHIMIGGQSIRQGKLFTSSFKFTNNENIYNTSGFIPSDFYNKFNRKWYVYNSSLSSSRIFDGISSLSVNSGSNIRTTTEPLLLDDFTISFDIFTTNFNNYGRLLQIGDNNKKGCLIIYGIPNSNLIHAQIVTSGTSYSNIVNISSSNYKHNNDNNVVLIRNKGVFEFYINGLKLQTTDTFLDYSITEDVYTIGANSANLEGISAYIKNFKVYRKKVIYPINTSNTIRLDFNNNFLDKYGNSSWYNYNLNFDYNNSFYGSSIYFNGSDHNLTTNNSINIDLQDFYFKTNINFISGNTYKVILNLIDSLYFYYNLGNKTFLIETYNSGSYLSGSSSKPIELNFNTFYKIELKIRFNKAFIFINNELADVVTIILPTNPIINSIIRIGRPPSNQSYFLYGYIDDIEIITKDANSIVSKTIDKPAVHLPLETNTTNIGFTSLTVNSVGNPTYAVINGKKCIKFESGKYLTIDSNSIFNLGVDSDFYFEIDIYINNWIPDTQGNNNRIYLLTTRDALTFGFRINQTTLKLEIRINGNNYIVNSTIFELNKFYNIKIYRKNINLYTSVNNVTETTDTVFNIQTNNLQMNIGGSDTYTNTYSDSYISNFKLFVGTSEIPSTYNDKKVLNLDFKPTNKSYLFKDNNNKCIIHPEKIIQRDYQDSQYCCYFKGDSQSLTLGKNNLLNFGNDDFIIEIIFKKSTSNGWRMLFCDNAESTNFIDIGTNNFLAVKMGGMRYDTPANSIKDGVITKVLLQVSNSILTVKINDEQVTLDGQLTQTVYNVNFNLHDNTFIGKYYSNMEYFRGYIYSIKVLRNTTDLSLLDDKDNGGEVGQPLDLVLQNVSTITNPEPGSFVNVSGRIYNPLTPPTVVAKINGISVSSSDITTSERANGDYDLNIKLLSDDLLLSNSLEVTVTDGVYTETRTTPIHIIRDKVLDLNSLDSFGTYWGQSNDLSKVSVRNFNDEEMMYFNGDSALVSNNTSFFLGLDKFTIELDFVVNTNPSGSGFHLISQGIVYNLTNYYSLVLNSDLSISFVTDKSNSSSNLNLRTTSGVISLNTKYRVSVTRDSDYTTRIFLNGIKVAERVINTNLGYSDQTSYENNVYVFLGREGTLYNNNTNIHFKGFMKNVSIRKGECAYTSDYSIEEHTRGILTKSLLTFSESNGSFVTKEDSFNRNITWNNTGTTVTNHELVFNGSQNRLTSSSNNMYNFGINNWTIDCIFTPSQILTEAVLLDLRTSANSFNGIMIRQSSSDPTSLTINIGSSTETQAYTYTVTTGVNSLKANQQTKLKIVRANGQIVVFLNDLETNRINVGTTIFITNTSVCLGNNLSYNRGFNGKIKQFRIINGTATNVYPVPIKSGEILT